MIANGSLSGGGVPSVATTRYSAAPRATRASDSSSAAPHPSASGPWALSRHNNTGVRASSSASSSTASVSPGCPSAVATVR